MVLLCLFEVFLCLLEVVLCAFQVLFCLCVVLLCHSEILLCLFAVVLCLSVVVRVTFLKKCVESLQRDTSHLTQWTPGPVPSRSVQFPVHDYHPQSHNASLA